MLSNAKLLSKLHFVMSSGFASSGNFCSGIFVNLILTRSDNSDSASFKPSFSLSFFSNSAVQSTKVVGEIRLQFGQTRVSVSFVIKEVSFFHVSNFSSQGYGERKSASFSIFKRNNVSVIRNSKLW